MRATMNANELLAEMDGVFGQGFVEAVVSAFGPEDLDERLAGGGKDVLRHVDKQAKREKRRSPAMKKAMKALEREADRGKKAREADRQRRGKAEFDKEGEAAQTDPDDVKKALSGLRAMRKGKKGEPKKGKSKEIASKKAKSKGGGAGARSRAKGSFGGGAGGQERAKQKGAAGSGAKGQHYPFRNSPNLGKGPGTPPGWSGSGPRHHNQKKCWNCDCGPVYTAGCLCKSTGADPKKCPKGQTKHVKINKSYRDAYNKMYHAWRSKKGGAVTARIKGGGRPGAF